MSPARGGVQPGLFQIHVCPGRLCCTPKQVHVTLRRQTRYMKVLTVGGLASYLHIHRSTIYRLLKRGDLPAFKIGSDWRFNIEAIDQWRLRQETAQVEARQQLDPGK
jgi:excisionase family DNA binding protein